MTPSKDYKDVLWSTPIQSRHDSGYGTIKTFGCNLNLSPIRKNTLSKPNLNIVVGKNCTLKLKQDKNSDSEVNRVTRRLPFLNFNLKDAQSQKPTDSGIESMCKTVDSQIISTEVSLRSKSQNLYRYLKSFPVDLRSDFLYVFGKNISDKPSQPYKYICKENTVQFENSSLDFSLSLSHDENNNEVENISLVKAKSETATDFLHELNIRNCTTIISIILSHLPNEDLRKASNVNKTWRNIVSNDKKANQRRTEYVNNKKNLRKGPNKENSLQIKSPTERSHKTAFHNVLNVSSEETQQPLFKDNFSGRFDSYCQVGNTLQNGDKLMKCPKCQYPSKILHENKYVCTRSLCQHEFCKKCSGPHLDNHTCPQPKLNPTLPNIFIGSKKSKKNLRRL